MSEDDVDRLQTLYAELKQRRPWANEDSYSGTTRVMKDLFYSASSLAIPHAGSRRFIRKKSQLAVATAGGSAMLNIFLKKTGEMFKGWDFTKYSAADLIDLARYTVSGNERLEFDPYRSVHAGEYFQLRSRLQTEGVLPHQWQFTFESIDEEGFGTFTDKMVTSLLLLYLTYEGIVGGPVSAHRVKHWWNIELAHKEHKLRKELYDAYLMKHDLDAGRPLASVEENYDSPYDESAYMHGAGFNAQAAQAFENGAILQDLDDFAVQQQPPPAAIPQDVHDAAEAAAAAAIAGGN